MAILLSFLLILMPVAQTAAIVPDALEAMQAESDTQLTTFGMFEYSSSENVFVFVLDRLDFTYIERVLEQEPDFLDRLDGFIGYDNVSASFARTEPALAHMFTGCESLAYNVPEREYFRDAWFEDGKNILKEISEQNFSIEIYTLKKDLFTDSSYCWQYVDNASTPSKSKPTPFEMFRKMMRMSAHGASDSVGTDAGIDGLFAADEYEKYEFEDHVHGPKLATATVTRSKKAFKFYHFNGPHAPYRITADGEHTNKRTSVEEQLMGCMKYLYDAFDRMKELGIYDDATIIITGDHGDAIDDYAPMRSPMRIGLFYKPAGSAGTPLAWSSAPLSSDNLAPTFVKCVGGDYSLYGTPIDEVAEDAEVVRYFRKSVCHDSSTEREVCVYEITGHAKDKENWKLIRRENISGPFYG